MHDIDEQPTTRPTAEAARSRSIHAPGMTIDLLEREEAVDIIRTRAQSDHLPPLAVGSINLDHVHHFGENGRWAGTIDRDRGMHEPQPTTIDWLNLIDGSPVARQAHRMTGRAWPRLAGSDLAGPVLDLAEHVGLTVGFLGGAAETHALLAERLAETRPELQVTGYWAPSRDELSDAESSRRIADEIAAAGVDILVVGIGKPRQELWIAEYGLRTGARVMLAFGAVVDFLAGRVRRAPGWVATAGLEWAWRLLLEPRRLARRYLGEGPAAYREVRAWSREHPAAPELRLPPVALARAGGAHGIVPLAEQADLAVIVVAHNSADDIPELMADLRREARDRRMHVVVVDNASTDRTAEAVRAERGVALLTGHGNVGYAAGINRGMRALRRPEPLLILNPDLRLDPGAVGALLDRMTATGAGIVVPRILDADGELYRSLHREPSIGREFGEALFGSRLAGRPASLSEIDWNVESYRFPHRIEWATGAALLVHPEVATAVGDWDERFFLYSEETDFFRRARDAGAAVWYDPSAVVRHEQGGSGSSPRLEALMTVNRVRYARKHLPAVGATVFATATALHELLRLHRPEHRLALRALLSRRARTALPAATR